MSYYNSAYSGSEYGEYNFNSYAVNYDYYNSPSFMSNNGYDDYNQPNYGYDPNMYYANSTNYPLQSYQTMSYSATTFSDPKSIEYDSNYGMTEFVISYNTLEFNEPLFDEYDPTPYDGGYDIAKTYGKPLPPSDKICYPRFGSAPVESIVPLPKVEEKIDKKAIVPQKVVEEEKPKEVENKSYDETLDMKPYEGEVSEEKEGEQDYGYEEKQVAIPQYVPSGYGLEAMDICESLFGYWPCLARMKREQHCCEEVCDRGNNNMYENMWKGSADYIFGNLDPYGGGRREYENSSSYASSDLVVYGYDYERHYLTQEQYRQIDYNDQSL